MKTHRSQPSADGTGLLHTEVKGSILLLFVELPEVLSLLVVDDSQNPGNGLADSVADRSKNNVSNEVLRNIICVRTFWSTWPQSHQRSSAPGG